MEYQGYVGTVEFSEEDRVFFGKVLGIRMLKLPLYAFSGFTFFSLHIAR